MYLLFLGPPGCGKGTQAQFLVENMGFSQLSTGDLIRAEIKAETPLGRRISAMSSVGKLVDDEIILEIVKKEIANNRSSRLLFDGFPRTLPQAIAFEEILREQGRSIAIVFSFALTDDEIKDRIVGRMTCMMCKSVYHERKNPVKVSGVCDKCGGSLMRRSDDTLEAISVRLDEYHRETDPLKLFYEEKGLVVSIDANQPIADVRCAIVQTLENESRVF